MSDNSDKLTKKLCKIFRVVTHGKYGKAIQKALEEAYSDGYKDGHEDQMKARILDAQECRRKHGR